MRKFKNLLWVCMAASLIAMPSCDNTDDELIEIPDIEEPNPDNNAGTIDSPYSVAGVIKINPSSTTATDYPGVWTEGYIVGYLDTSGTENVPVFNATEGTVSDLNLFIADSKEETNVSKTVCVQIPATFRGVLGLATNPANIGKKLAIKGDILKYNTFPGMKNLASYLLDGEGPGEVAGGSISVSGDASKAAAYVEYDFSDAVANSNISRAEWQNVAIEGDRLWTGKTFDNNGYAQATAHNGTAAKYETWLITQGLDLSKAESKSFSFKTAQAYWKETTTFEVYVLQNNGTETVRTKLEGLNLATSSTANYAFVSSGDIDLSKYTGIVYVGFRYSADGGASNSTTWCVDDVVLGKKETVDTSTKVSLHYTNPSVVTGKEYEATISTDIINGEGNTVITATGLPEWAALTDNGDGTATIKGTAPAAAETSEVTVTATNNNVSTEKTFTIKVTEPVDPSAEIVTNGYFTDGINGWTTKPQNESDAAIYNITTPDGVLISQTGSATGRFDLYQEITTVEVGATYTLSFKYKANANKLRIWSYCIDSANSWIYFGTTAETDPFRTNNKYLGPTEDWTDWSEEFTVPAGSDKLHLEFRAYRQDGCEVGIKDVVITKK